MFYSTEGMENTKVSIRYKNKFDSFISIGYKSIEKYLKVYQNDIDAVGW